MDLVTFGEAMVRLTPPSFQRLEQARSLGVYVGGGELNVAVAAARLGIASRWVSRLPENVLGRMIANAAREQGDAVRFATATSALKHSIPGDFCLVTRSEVEQLLSGGSLRVSR